MGRWMGLVKFIFLMNNLPPLWNFIMISLLLFDAAILYDSQLPARSAGEQPKDAHLDRADRSIHTAGRQNPDFQVCLVFYM